MVRVEKIPVPSKEIPEGIRLCFENCKRLLDDSDFLSENRRISSAIVNLILAQEEFAKTIILLGHYKSGSGISKNQSGDIFSSHELKLKKFIRFFQSAVIKSDENFMEKFAQFWFANQNLKENHMYVNWTKAGWKAPKPEKKDQIAESGIWAFKNINWVMHAAMLNSCLKALGEDEEFKKILKK